MNSFIVISCICLISIASAQYHHDDHKDYHAPAHYTYEYDVHDPHTGDVKSAHESRKGDSVTGYYKLKDADGTEREVHYTADKHNGFNAIVKKNGHPIIHQAEHHHQPIQHVEHHAPHHYETHGVHDHHATSHQAVYLH